MRRPGHVLVIAAALGVAMILTGCGNDSDSASTAEAPSGGAEAAGEDTALARAQIVEAELRVVVDDPPAAAAQAAGLVEHVDGYVEQETTTLGDTASSYLTLRVPVDSLAATMDDISSFGELEHRSVSREDVTAQVADVESRVRSATNSITRLNELIARADAVADIVAIESELATRESELEALQAQQRSLGNQVTLAQLNVTLRSTADDSTDLPGPLDALSAGGSVFLNVLRVALLAFAFSLPLLTTALVVAWLLRGILRRRRKNRPAPPPPIPQPSPLPPPNEPVE